MVDKHKHNETQVYLRTMNVFIHSHSHLTLVINKAPVVKKHQIPQLVPCPVPVKRGGGESVLIFNYIIDGLNEKRRKTDTGGMGFGKVGQRAVKNRNKANLGSS